MRENDVASRQQESSGVVSECNKGTRGVNYCHYIFSANNGEPREGFSEAESSVALGQTVRVYYDSENPSSNALKDFTVTSRSNALWACGETLAVLLMGAYAFSQRHRLFEDKQTS